MSADANLTIWSQVQETDPRFTKPVSYGKRHYTDITPHYCIKRATELFGPCGTGWGFDVKYEMIHAVDEIPIAIASHVTVWFEHKTQSFGPIVGIRNLEPGMTDAKFRVIDEDAFKSATTDALTKALSYIGIGADVFLGMYDNPQYMHDLRQKYGGGPTGKIDTATKLAPPVPPSDDPKLQDPEQRISVAAVEAMMNPKIKDGQTPAQYFTIIRERLMLRRDEGVLRLSKFNDLMNLWRAELAKRVTQSEFDTISQADELFSRETVKI